ncbi:MAG TPA: site-2 protease family protein [Vicinamibacterales bacterium]
MQGIDVGQLLTAFLILLFSLTIHESSHAWTADRLGDPTARLLGRVSLNPLVHIDPIGTILFPLLGLFSPVPLIGWAKPVPVNISRLRRHRRDYVLVAAAGPASNLLLALVASSVLSLLPAPEAAVESVRRLGYPASMAMLIIQINVFLAVFNMVPVPPLDGGNVLAGLLPPQLGSVIDGLRPYGFLILYALLLTGTLWSLIGPVADALISWLQ